MTRSTNIYTFDYLYMFHSPSYGKIYNIYIYIDIIRLLVIYMLSGFNIDISGSKVPITYGAIMNNSDSVRTVSTVNIYTSISNLSDAYVPRVDNYDNVDDYFIVMPGYKLIVYQDVNHSGSSYTIDNTTGTTPFFKKSNTGTANTASSVRLYYKYDNNELTEFT